MNNNEKGNKNKPWLNQRTVALVGLVVIFLFSFPFFKNLNQRHKINKEIKELEEEIEKTSNQNSDLKKMIGYLESNQFIEEQARLNFGLKKSGEEVIIIKNEAGATSTEDETIFNIPGLKNKKQAAKISNPAKWWKYFFN
jgi:cell division protein FtsB